jgi:lysophospholipase L1-like esterase
VEPPAKAWIKRLLGKATRQEVNVKRNEFNDLMRQTYAGIDPIFDLAEVESTHGNGSRSYFMQGDEKIYTLAPEFTTDGGHLNEVGRRMAAERLLLVLAQSDVTSPTSGPSHASQYISH